MGEECEGIHEVLVYAIQKSDLDLRRVLFQNIVLSGGSTLFKVSIVHVYCYKYRHNSSSVATLIFFPQGFGDRLLSEIKKVAPKDIKIRVSYVMICFLPTQGL